MPVRRFLHAGHVIPAIHGVASQLLFSAHPQAQLFSFVTIKWRATFKLAVFNLDQHVVHHTANIV